MIYFTADNHFCHEKIIKTCNRPFKNVNEMNKEMIDRWNSCITDDDDVYILGDFLHKGMGKQAEQILLRLKGKKYLIKGNHEKYLEADDFKQNYFQWIKDYYVLNYENYEIILFHFPILQWHKEHRGSIHLYGHIHNNVENYTEYKEKIEVLGRKAINVGVDVNDFYSVSIKKVIEIIK